MRGGKHHFWRSKPLSLLGLLWSASVLSSAYPADFSYGHENNLPYEPFSLQWGSDIPPDLLRQLTARAGLNRRMARSFTCSEEIYRDNSEAKVFDYLLRESTENRRALVGDVEPLRFKGSSASRASFKDSLPPAFAWTYLFSDTYQPNFTYRYLGESVEGFHSSHRIAFRGIRRFDKGTDIREWEGIAIVDAETYEILRIDAAPRNYAPIVEYRRRKYQMSFNLIGIRFRKRPRVQVLSVELSETPIETDLSRVSAGNPQGTQDRVMKLPTKVVWHEYRMDGSGGFFRKWTEERRYLDYRFFDVEAREPETGSSTGD